MTENRILQIAVAALVVLVATFFSYSHWHGKNRDGGRETILALMPEDSSAIAYLDLEQLRSSALLAELFRWAPKATPDNEYADFLQSTGFNYETDLERIGLSLSRQSPGMSAFAVVEGKFDRKKIETFGSRYGSLKTADGKTLFAVPLKGSRRKAYFTFLRDNRVAWSNDSSYFFQKPRGASSTEWREHFLRVAGMPVFAVLRQDVGAEAALAQAPGGFRSPQLAGLLEQLQWISVAAKAEGDLLRVSIEGECVSESTEHQLKDVLSGMVVLAQMGLNDPGNRKKLDPAMREGYLELLQSADIQQVDRGSSKSVRVVFDVTPKLWESREKEGSASGSDPGGH